MHETESGKAVTTTRQTGAQDQARADQLNEDIRREDEKPNTQSQVYEQILQQQIRQMERAPFVGRVEEEGQKRKDNDPTPDHSNEQQTFTGHGSRVHWFTGSPSFSSSNQSWTLTRPTPTPSEQQVPGH